MSDDPDLIPGTECLRNRLGLDDPKLLDFAERRFATQRAAEGIQSGSFDLDHLRAIHRHLFQDVYDWAGELRTVEISKGGNHFIFRQLIERGMGDVHRRLTTADFLRGLDAQAFAAEALRPPLPRGQRAYPVALP